MPKDGESIGSVQKMSCFKCRSESCVGVRADDAGCDSLRSHFRPMYCLGITLPHNNHSYNYYKTKSARSCRPCNQLANMTAQTSHPIQIPEILCQVLDYLKSDSKALSAACRVNKVWNAICLDILWCSHHQDGIARLASLPKCRRQFYADKIRFLTMEWCPIEYRQWTETLNFPRLRTLGVSLNAYSCWDFSHLLIPTLEEFQLYHASRQQQPHLEISLSRLAERCPNLRTLRLCSSNYPPEIHSFKDYLKKFSKLRSVDLTGMHDSTITNDVFIYLASIPLRELHMKRLVTSNMVDMAHEQLGSDSLFPNVEYIDFTMEGHAAAMLLPVLTTLRNLRIELVSGDANHEVFQAIGTLEGLRTLHLITARTAQSVSRDEILAIGKLRKLRNLTIYSRLTVDKSVTDDVMVSFLSSFPEVESIYINTFHNSFIPSLAMVALATTSKQLSDFSFYGTLDVGFLESISVTPLFSRLRKMYCHRFHYPNMPKG